jgi:hypothetical protein
VLRITNKSFGPLCFREKPSEDEPAGKIVEILPGETKPVETTRENVNVAAYLSTQLISVLDDEADEKAPAKETRGKARADAGTGDQPPA